MASVHKLMGRLNAATCRFDIGRGGIPELTPQDIAGALGMIRDEFAREVFCAVWWPDGARLMWRDLDRIIAGMQYAEWRKRADVVVTAQLAVAQAELRKDSHGTFLARRELEAARENMWPALHEDVYSKIRHGVIAEIRAPKLCASCQGRAEVKVGELVVLCEACDGAGVIPVSDRRRADIIGRALSTYQKSWRKVYEWTHRTVSDAEHAGAREFAERIAA